MRRSTLAIIVAIIVAVTILTAFVASELSQYNSTVTVKNGVGYALTANGMESLDTIHENGIQIVSLKITGYSNVPATLPNTSTPHGDYTCTMHNHGVTFTVTQNTPCE